jgi:hypothetical protein
MSWLPREHPLGFARTFLPRGALRETAHRFAHCMSTAGRFDLRLPPGRYEFWVYGTGLEGKRMTLRLRPGQGLDLGAVDVPAEYLALMRGKELPEWTVTAARGRELEQSTLASFRGKWVLVEFWGFW